MGKHQTKPLVLEVAIAGAGIKPADVTIGHLSDLLAATTEVLAAMAAETGVSSPLPSLVRVRKGSAAFDMSSKDPRWEATTERLYAAVKSRGAHAHPRLRAGLERLFRAGKVGSVRIGMMDGLVPREDRPALILAAPLEAEPTTVLFTRSAYGRVVGVMELATRWSVRLALTSGGGRVDLGADEDLAMLAARLFGKQVQALIGCTLLDDGAAPETLLRLDAWRNDDLLEVMADVRKHTSAGSVPLAEILADLEDR
jgi:hypothetical protein